MSGEHPATIQVALPLPLLESFTYLVPPGLAPPPPGARVRVPFGSRHLVGFAVADPSRRGAAIEEHRLRPLEAVLDTSPLLPPDVLELTRRIAEYYQTSWGLTLRCAYPSGLDPVPRLRFSLTEEGLALREDGLNPLREALGVCPGGDLAPKPLQALRALLGPPADSLLHRALRESVVIQEERWGAVRHRAGRDRIALLRSPDELAEKASDDSVPAFHRKAMKVLASIGGRGFPLVSEAASLARVPQYVFQELAEAGFLELFEMVPARLQGEPSPHSLNDEQEACVRAVAQAQAGRCAEIFLLYGVTGSGKTEVYMRLMEKALEAGGTALYMVPEISMTSFLARRMLQRFGAQVAILHSAMNERERIRQWIRCRKGEARLVIGPRSSLFAPLPDLRVVVVDEEHDGSYRQHEVPRFSARDMAILRGRILGAPVVLGSATPSVESYYNATEGGKYRLLTLTERAGGASVPAVEVVDMRRQYQETGVRASLSAQLREALEANLRDRRQSVILRNRLGFDTFVLCRKCGKTIQCDACSISMTHHRRAGILKCHYCGAERSVPLVCPSCGAEVLHFLGEGTEKVEDTLAELFPGARIERMDRDRIRTGAEYDRLWKAFEAGQIDILVGTQMVAKGHDVANVTLVGILSADFLLGLPDFRSAERTFQLVTQAAGRAGRGEHAGRVILQSFHPEHYAVEAAAAQDFLAFYEKDIRYRKLVGYPPAAALAKVEVRHADGGKAESLARQASAILRANLKPPSRVLGPVEAPIPRLEGKYRRLIVLKAPTRNSLRTALGELLRSPFGTKHLGKTLDADIDPGSMM